MKRIEFTIGIGMDRDNNPVPEPEILIQRVVKVAAYRFGGFTLTYGTGGWMNAGKLVMESNITILVMTDQSDEKINEYAVYLKDVFKQSAIMVTVTQAEVDYI